MPSQYSSWKLVTRKALARWLFVALVVALGSGELAFAQRLQLKDGRVLTGRIAKTSGVGDTSDSAPSHAGEIATQPIYVIDDDLRRVFISNQQANRLIDEAPEKQVSIKLWQNIAQGSSGIASVGPSLGITPFDEYGRRIYKMQTGRGPLSVIQGITELTPRYARVEALLGQPRSPVWDCRIATSSIPSATVAAILKQTLPQDDPEARLQAVRFYVDSQKYADAGKELKAIIADFPKMKDLERELKQINQLAARRILTEIQLRKDAGQHQLVHALLQNFPTEEVAGETLQQVRELISKYDKAQLRIDATKKNIASIVADISDPDDRGIAAPLMAEITGELSHNNIDRLAPFSQFVDDASMSAEEKAALALSGWLLGADQATQKLAVAISLVKIRDGVIRYLREPLAHERSTIVDNLRSLEGASVDRVARLLSMIKPPLHDNELVKPPSAENGFGSLSLAAPGQTEDGDFQYLIQLPPEYDPHLRYPTIIALNGAYNSPVQELDFWAGSPRVNQAGQIVGARLGQAMRRGYIVISVDWQKPQQYRYEYSAREHVAVLTCLRDACRRFSIDTDRVFLTGHGTGGDASWDLAQSHPDVWAGALPFVAQIGKYGSYYWENARYVPLYFVAGELDGAKMKQNSTLFDRFLGRRFDATVVEYLGRGHEPFHDEIHYAFEWMNRRRRGKIPEEFTCSTLRPWDNFFWWIECQKFPVKWMIHPAEWTGRGARATEVEGKLLAGNRLLVKTAAEGATIWLNPEMVDFDEPVRVTINGNNVRGARESISPQIDVLLEDARTRADRQRPYWAKLVWPAEER
ncbi:peptidase [Adhaeretor mobilis]|nr:peptidase [Adhaeretor mobilis]